MYKVSKCNKLQRKASPLLSKTKAPFLQPKIPFPTLERNEANSIHTHPIWAHTGMHVYINDIHQRAVITATGKEQVRVKPNYAVKELQCKLILYIGAIKKDSLDLNDNVAAFIGPHIGT